MSKSDNVLEFIQEFQMAYPGMSPTYREINFALGVSSTGSLKYTVDNLMSQGEIIPYGEGTSRGMVLKDTVLLTRELAEKLHIDFNQLLQLRDHARQRIDERLSRRPVRVSYERTDKHQIRRVYTP